MKEGTLPPDPETLLRLKEAILDDFRQLPAEHKATIGLVLVSAVLDGEWGTWFKDALHYTLARTKDELPVGEALSFPTNWVAKEDLLSIRPDLAAQIQALDETALAKIADKVGDALSETYWITLPIILASYLGVSALGMNVDDTPTDEPDLSPHWEWSTEARRELDRLPPLMTGVDNQPPLSRADIPTQGNVPDTPNNPEPEC